MTINGFDSPKLFGMLLVLLTGNGFDSPKLFGMLLVLLTGNEWELSISTSGRSTIAIHLDNQITLYFEVT